MSRSVASFHWTGPRTEAAALLAARRLMRGDPSALSAQIEAESEVFKQCMGSPEAQEAFAAFFEKRPPDFAKARAKAKG